LLIADDVGIGKTIEACLIARELLDRGETLRLAVLCPPHLAEQWQAELRDKFHIEAELVLPGTARRLERDCGVGQSLFDLYPHVVVSMDFIKSDRRRDEFLRTCPELIIVDEAHTCAWGQEGRGGGRHQRHQLLKGLAGKSDRHVILVTATPHSGNETAFRSLLTLLNPAFANLPEDLTGKQNEQHRRHLAAHFVQRRRADIRHYMQADTPFPDREEAEETYKLSPEYKALFARVLEYARETVRDAQGGQHHQRVRWWSALALLRSLASSPAAAAATLRTRSSSADTDNPDDANEIGQRSVLDLMDDESAEGMDVAPGADVSDPADQSQKNRRRLLDMARAADALMGEQDDKLKKAFKLVKSLLDDGFRPIVFCRFIPTAEYVAEELRKRLPAKVEVAAVTGLLPPAEREERILQLASDPDRPRVLVCTDCLSEGINLQDHFDAVLHYDLSWNPTRHEQREGRVDRYGQRTEKVRVLTYYGLDNQIDGIVLDVLIRKHKKIHNSLGISVPVPVPAEHVIEAIFEGLLLREQAGSAQDQLTMFEDYFKPKKEEIHSDWDSVADREKRSRTMFAQETIKVEEVARELQAVRAAIGSNLDVATFTKDAFRAHNAVITGNGTVKLDLREVPAGLREATGNRQTFAGRFELPVREGELLLTRTHPVVEGLANYVFNTALDPLTSGIARRAGVIRTQHVKQRTTLLLVRFRYHILTKHGDQEYPLLAEDCQLCAFVGAPQKAEWLPAETAEMLLGAKPDANVPADAARHHLQRIIADFDHLRPHLDAVAKKRGDELLDAHRRVRQAAHVTGISHRVEPKLPPDVLGVYVYLPTD
jgi:hypothetical protein